MDNILPLSNTEIKKLNILMKVVKNEQELYGKYILKYDNERIAYFFIENDKKVEIDRNKMQVI